MNAGDLNKRVTIEAPTVTQSSTTGEPLTSWATHATVWASVRPVSVSKSAEAILAGRTTVENAVTVSMRYIATVTAAMRLTCDGHTYNIMALQDVDAAHRELRLACVEVV